MIDDLLIASKELQFLKEKFESFIDRTNKELERITHRVKKDEPKKPIEPE